MCRCGKRVSSEDQELVLFIDGLVQGGVAARRPPRALTRLAAQVLDRMPAARHLEPEDLVSELTVRLLDRARSGVHPLGEGARNPRAVLRHRLAQLAAEQQTGRAVVKELTAHVRRLFTAGRPAPAPRPERLDRAGRLDASSIRQAMGWALGSGNAPPEARDDARALARWLAGEFNLLVHAVAQDAADHLAAGDLDRAPAISEARRLATRLGPEAVRALALKLSGAPLRIAALHLGTTVTGAHQRTHAAEDLFRDEVLASNIPPELAHAVLGLFAELGIECQGGPAPATRPARRARRKIQEPCAVPA